MPDVPGLKSSSGSSSDSTGSTAAAAAATPGVMQLREGDLLKLKCTSIGGYPPPNVRWIKLLKVSSGSTLGNTSASSSSLTTSSEEREISLVESKSDSSPGSVSSEIQIRLSRSDNGASLKCAVSNEAITSPLYALVPLPQIIFASDVIKVTPEDSLKVKASDSLTIGRGGNINSLASGNSGNHQLQTPADTLPSHHQHQQHHHQHSSHHQSNSHNNQHHLSSSGTFHRHSHKQVPKQFTPDHLPAIEVTCETGDCLPACNLTWFHGGIKLTDTIYTTVTPASYGGFVTLSRLHLVKKWTSHEDATSITCSSTHPALPNRRITRSLTVHVLCKFLLSSSLHPNSLLPPHMALVRPGEKRVYIWIFNAITWILVTESLSLSLWFMWSLPRRTVIPSSCVSKICPKYIHLCVQCVPLCCTSPCLFYPHLQFALAPPEQFTSWIGSLFLAKLSSSCYFVLLSPRVPSPCLRGRLTYPHFLFFNISPVSLNKQVYWNNRPAVYSLIHLFSFPRVNLFFVCVSNYSLMHLQFHSRRGEYFVWMDKISASVSLVSFLSFFYSHYSVCVCALPFASFHYTCELLLLLWTLTVELVCYVFSSLSQLHTRVLGSVLWSFISVISSSLSSSLLLSFCLLALFSCSHSSQFDSISISFPFSFPLFLLALFFLFFLFHLPWSKCILTIIWFPPLFFSPSLAPILPQTGPKSNWLLNCRLFFLPPPLTSSCALFRESKHLIFQFGYKSCIFVEFARAYEIEICHFKINSPAPFSCSTFIWLAFSLPLCTFSLPLPLLLTWLCPWHKLFWQGEGKMHDFSLLWPTFNPCQCQLYKQVTFVHFCISRSLHFCLPHQMVQVECCFLCLVLSVARRRTNQSIGQWLEIDPPVVPLLQVTYPLSFSYLLLFPATGTLLLSHFASFSAFSFSPFSFTLTHFLFLPDSRWFSFCPPIHAWDLFYLPVTL